jgi:hypothetical protein
MSSDISLLPGKQEMVCDPGGDDISSKDVCIIVYENKSFAGQDLQAGSQFIQKIFNAGSWS